MGVLGSFSEISVVPLPQSEDSTEKIQAMAPQHQTSPLRHPCELQGDRLEGVKAGKEMHARSGIHPEE